MTTPDPWPLPQRLDLRDGLIERYAHGRGYHDLVHLSEVLDRLRELGAGESTEVVLAAWYHDAVYDEQGDNEARSAALAQAELAGEPIDVQEVGRLVRLTESHRPDAGDHNGALLCDADLAILAAPPERYRSYVEGVRREYARYDDATFAAGRATVLRDLMAKPTLFHTEQARAQWEDAARANLAAELEGLEAMREAGE